MNKSIAFLTAISILLAAILLATPTMTQQPNDFKERWKQIDSLLDKGKPQDALKMANAAYSLAAKNKMDAELLRALLYRMAISAQIEENAELNNLALLQKEIATLKPPAQQVAHSLLAQTYWRYFQNQRWKIYNRTTGAEANAGDPSTWSAADFQKFISHHFQQSLRNSDASQKTLISQFGAMTIPGNQPTLRPTLYDLLAHEALGFFTVNEIEITKPADAFVLKDDASLAPARIFIKHDYESPDSLNQVLQALRIYQQLTAFHLQKGNTDALADIEIQRVVFAHEHHKGRQKEILYKEALAHLYEQYGNNAYGMQAGYLLAEWWQQKADAYTPVSGDKEAANGYRIAADYCRAIIKKFPDSEGGKNAQNLLHQLNEKQVGLTLEVVNVPTQAFRSLLQWKNTSNIYLRIVPLSNSLIKLLDEDADYNGDNKLWNALLEAKPQKQWRQALPAFDDMREHSAEIKIDGLPIGRYAVIASVKDDFSLMENSLSYTPFHVSNISHAGLGLDQFVLNRTTGQPLDGATVKVFETYYDYNARKQRSKLTETLITDGQGHVKVARDDDRRGALHFEISHQQDYLNVQDGVPAYPVYYRGYNQREDYRLATKAGQEEFRKDNARFFFFLDRGLYRPGQKVYFKAIAVTRDPKTMQSQLLIPAKPVQVRLYDANNQKLDSLFLPVNEYGSISGSFTLPQQTLTGNFRLSVDEYNAVSAGFKVEEYKRPKFFTTINQPTAEYKVGDTIAVDGEAKAYAGNALDGAQVQYRVFRSTRFDYPWLYRGYGRIMPPYGGERQEIVQGETTTNADGKFTIRFAAMGDDAVDKNLLPNYTYTIEASVTDINGETHDASQTVTAGYRSLMLSLNGIGEYVNAQKMPTLSVGAATLNGSAVKTPLQVKIYALDAPKHELRKRYWEAPDTSVMSETEFRKNFPTDPYRNEDEKAEWQRAQLTQTILLPDTASQHTVALPKLPVGWYEIAVEGSDKDGLPVMTTHRFAIVDEAANKLPGFLHTYIPNATVDAQPGEDAVIVLGTSVNDPYLIELETRHEREQADPKEFVYRLLHNTIDTTTYAIKEKDRGGFNVARMFVHNNRMYTANYYVRVPYTNKQLKITWQTFRDKLLPGSEEKWTATVEGLAGEKIAAEVVAGMYDASLDQIYPFNWNTPNVWNNKYFGYSFQGNSNFQALDGQEKVPNYTAQYYSKTYAQLRRIRGSIYGEEYNKVFSAVPGNAATLQGRAAGLAIAESAQMADAELKEVVVTGYGSRMNNAAPPAAPEEEAAKEQQNTDAPENVQIRKNFNETAFFFPDLKTDKDGRIQFSFTMPEALTEWKMQLLGHTQELAFGKYQASVITQKELMVQPFTPRFMRQGDGMELSVKIVNLTEKETTGSATLELLDASTLKPVDGYFKNVFPNQYFTAPAKGSIALRFPVEAPAQYEGGLVYRIIAKANNGNSDGEELIIPVLPDRLLVTESMPIYMNGIGQKQMDFAKLLQSSQSPTLQHQSITVEYSANPVWYAVQSLPYLMEYPYDCAEQTWNRYYANRLAAFILNSNPAIAAVIEKWRGSGSDQLVSNLQKNEELKQLLLAETPWLLAGKNETEQKQQLAMLMQADKMQAESIKALNKLRELQAPNGGFVWFKGGPDDRYITQYIVASMGHLQRLKAWPANGNEKQQLEQMVSRAMNYLHQRAAEDFKQLKKREKDLGKHLLRGIDIQYLYAYSHFTQPKPGAETQAAIDFYRTQAFAHWLKHGKQEQGMIALYANRTTAATKAKEIMASLKQYSTTADEFGRYWKEFNNPSYYWWQAPVESHALLTVAFDEIEKDKQTTFELKTWLLKQKQTQHWKTTRATADACYALLVTGGSWVNAAPQVNINLGKEKVTAPADAGTGYFKTSISGEKVTPDMGKVTVNVSRGNTPTGSEVPPSWGAVYWQYYEKLENITTAETGVAIKKQLFIKKNTANGPTLTPIADGNTIQKGSTVTVRLVITADRTLEYVHLKDMRAATFEPKKQLSGYKYQGGLGYYEAPGDVATNFFISYLGKGTYVFEYDMVATIDGNFTNGITTLQCMYAPEFSTHSQGIRVQVGE